MYVRWVVQGTCVYTSPLSSPVSLPLPLPSFLLSLFFPLLSIIPLFPPLSFLLLLCPPPALPSPPCLPPSSSPSLPQEAIDAAMSTLNSVLESERPERCVDEYDMSLLRLVHGHRSSSSWSPSEHHLLCVTHSMYQVASCSCQLRFHC